MLGLPELFKVGLLVVNVLLTYLVELGIREGVLLAPLFIEAFEEQLNEGLEVSHYRMGQTGQFHGT